MNLKTAVLLVSSVLVLPSAGYFVFRLEKFQRTLSHARAWLNVQTARAAAGPFEGLVAHQEDRAECETPGCVPRVTLTSVIAIDRDGARSERLTPAELEGEQWQIYGRGVTATAFPRVGKYFAIRNDKASPASTRSSMLDGAKDCVVALDGTPQEFTVLGHEEVAGYRTVKTKHNRANSIAWRAPDLGCFVLKAEERFANPKGGPEQIVRKTTTSLKVGPPPPEYFSFPSQFTHEAPIAVWTAQIEQRMKGEAQTRALAGVQNNPMIRKVQGTWEASAEKLDLHRPVP
jgi:hypothetical protein